MAYKDLNKRRAADKRRDATPERKEKHRAVNRRSWPAYYAKNRERILERKRAYRARRKDLTRGEKWRLKYGMSYPDYCALEARQGGMCAICGRPAPTGGVLCVDHDHETGIVRGLLCKLCNSLLGYAKDDPMMLDRAIGYLVG